jgi:hypothetical protein
VYVYVRVCGVRFDEEACGGVSPWLALVIMSAVSPGLILVS